MQQALKICSLLLFSCIIGISSLSARESASIVICAETGKVHHQANADAPIPPASLTKMMTLYLTFQALRDKRLHLDQMLPVSKHASRQSPCKLWLKPGSFISVRQAILGAVTKSANDATAVLAEALGGGSEAHFASKMTSCAHQLGMKNTVFKNASGLPSKHQITTARDMATLSRALYKHFPEYFKVFKEQKFSYKGQVHANHNHLLGKVKGVDGIKTGFTCASGFNLAASMVRDNKRIIAVVLGGESIKARDKKMERLLETTHAQLTKGNNTYASQYATLDDLIYNLGPSEANAAPLPKKVEASSRKAVYLSGTGKVRTLEAKFNSVEDLLEVVDERKTVQKPISKKSQKSTKKKAPKKTVLKATPKKSPTKKHAPKKNLKKTSTKKHTPKKSPTKQTSKKKKKLH